mgnify:CR=1 FL=1
MSLMNSPPDVIWLQFHGDAAPDDDDGPVCSDDVTWCDDKIFDHDIPYAHVPFIRRTVYNMRLVASAWDDQHKKETLLAFARELERAIGEKA